MPKYVDCDKVTEILKAHAKDGNNMTLISDETAIALDRLSAADVVERKKGAWETGR